MRTIGDGTRNTARNWRLWTSSPTEYAFGTRTAQFHVCGTCGLVPFVTIDIDGHEYAVVSVNSFEGVPASMLSRAPASFDGEGQGGRLARRAKNWIPSVLYIDDGA